MKLNFSCSIIRLKRSHKIIDSINIADIFNSLKANEIFETVLDDHKIIIKHLDDAHDPRDECLALLCTDDSIAADDILYCLGLNKN